MPETVLNGCRHHWEEAGSGPALVLLHGAAGSGRQLSRHIEPLSEHFRVIVPDLRGLGRSERVGPDTPVTAWVDDLRALQDELGLGPLNIYGMTVGGRVAMRFAADTPDRAGCLIVDMPVMFNEESAQAGVRGQVDLAKMPEQRRKQLQDWHGDQWEQAVRFYHEFRDRPEWQEYFDLREHSRKITARTLILRGDAPGDAYSAEHAFLLYRNLPGSWLWIRPRTDGGLLRNAPQETYRLIQEFVTADAGAGPVGSTY
ncbi:MAG: alpha/beta fold hydrolase [Micromonosporaceae bacterium]|nr:alpha/beta fold hydrolase [Micromonosporaceae bacterium]